MAANASRVKFLVDFDDSVTLRDPTDGTETATAAEAAISLNELDTAYWHDGNEIPYGVLKVLINVTSTDATTGDETYVLSIRVDDVAAQNDSPVTVWSQTIARGFTGVIMADIDVDNIPRLDTDTTGTDKFIAIVATLGGTTPIIGYGAWIVKSVKG